MIDQLLGYEVTPMPLAEIQRIHRLFESPAVEVSKAIPDSGSEQAKNDCFDSFFGVLARPVAVEKSTRQQQAHPLETLKSVLSEPVQRQSAKPAERSESDKNACFDRCFPRPNNSVIRVV